MTQPKTTLRELIARVDKSRTTGDASDVLDEFGIDTYREFDFTGFEAVVKEYWLAPWYCTDSWVGLSVLFLDDTPVAVAMQEGRKCAKNYSWISAELRDQTRAACLSFATQPPDVFSAANLDEELPTHYTVGYGEQLLVETGKYQGELVKVKNKRFAYNDPHWGKVEVEKADGTSLVIPPEELRLDYWVTA